MSSLTFSQKKFTPTAPANGSFPLDHENICKRVMLQYMTCLRLNRDETSNCRQEAQSYLQCRMDNNLMAKEEWTKLGFDQKSSKTTQ